jgi:hypothetical protein
MAEARLLRERIAAALRREEAPFFPERRHRYEPHEPDRRRPTGCSVPRSDAAHRRN